MANAAEEPAPDVPSLEVVSLVPKIPARRLRVIEYATQDEQLKERQRQQRAAKIPVEKTDIAYSARVWAQVTLPYRDPGKDPENKGYWMRKHNAITLTMRPALLTAPDGTRYEGYPFGLLPRHALTWLATEAVRTQSPVITLGSSMNSFMTKLGLARGGADQKRLVNQLNRLFRSHLEIEDLMTNASGTGERHQSLQVASAHQIWTSSKDSDDPTSVPLFNSEVTLSTEFFESMINAPVPVDQRALKALGSSPMRLDMYIFFAHRLFNMERPTRIKWEDLNQQFGGQYTNTRQFKAQFTKNLDEVRIVYPELRVEVHPQYLILKPSPPHIAPTKRRNELI
jgi:hypothetical protein